MNKFEIVYLMFHYNNLNNNNMLLIVHTLFQVFQVYNLDLMHHVLLDQVDDQLRYKILFSINIHTREEKEKERKQLSN